MHEVRRSALLALTLLGCGGTSPRAQAPSDPLVIPPMGSAAIANTPPPPPPPPPPPHTPSTDECRIIMRRIVDLTLDQSQITDKAQRDSVITSFLDNAEMMKTSCSRLKVDDDGMRCMTDASTLAEIQKCMTAASGQTADDDDDDR